jgi:hypothetical protein
MGHSGAHSPELPRASDAPFGRPLIVDRAARTSSDFPPPAPAPAPAPAPSTSTQHQHPAPMRDTFYEVEVPVQLARRDALGM